MKYYVIPAQLILVIFKFCGKEFSLSYPRHEDVVTLPFHRESIPIFPLVNQLIRRRTLLP
jgi:hypothetical protein